MIIHRREGPVGCAVIYRRKWYVITKAATPEVDGEAAELVLPLGWQMLYKHSVYAGSLPDWSDCKLQESEVVREA